MPKGELLPCPFCGGNADPSGWLCDDGRTGPECDGCGATAENAEAWNRRSDRAGLIAGLRDAASQIDAAAAAWHPDGIARTAIASLAKSIRARIATLETEEG